MIKIKKTITVFILACSVTVASAQNSNDSTNLVVTGTVLDASTGSPIEGISIVYSDFSATFTDSSGLFSINIPTFQTTILVQGQEYQTKEVALKGKDNIVVYLYESNYPSFNEYANTFYTRKPVAYSTNSVVTLNKNNKNWKKPGTSIEESFNGEIPGLNMITRSGALGIGADMYLRGYTSLYANNQPLIIVDGLIYNSLEHGKSIINGFSSNQLSYIDLNDIENITFIRDAASIYGAKASNGILYIRTNHAYKMATSINFTTYGGIKYAPKQSIPLLESDDYKRYLAEILQTSGMHPDTIQSLPYMNDSEEYTDYYRYHNNIDWRDEVFTNSYSQYYNLKIAGGDDVALYALSLGYIDHNGIVKNTDFSRYFIRFNSDINISAKLSVNANLGFTYGQHNLKEDGYTPFTNPIYLSHFKSPFTYPYVITSTGAISPNLEDVDAIGTGNPVAVIEEMNAVSKNYNIFGAFNINYQILKCLTLSNLIGYNFNKERDNLFIPHSGIVDDTLYLGVADNQMAHKVSHIFSFNDDLRLSYFRSINSIHHIYGLLGVRLGYDQLQDDWGKGYNSPNDETQSIGTGSNLLREVGGYLGNYKWMTYYATAEYNYQYRYFLTLSMAFDGSSRFGEEAEGISMFSSKFGTFPSISAAWLVSSESFLSDVTIIDLLKLRASYGITGNDDIGNYSAKKYYISQNLLGSQGLVKGALWNPGLQWETNRKMNAGIDLSVLRERLSVSFDLFQNTTEDMLNTLEADPLSGFDVYIANEGSFKSTGYEIAVKGRIINSNIKWDIGLNIAKYKTEVIEFPDGQRITPLMDAYILTSEGQPLGLFYGYKTLGVFASQAEAEASGLSALMPNTDSIPFEAGDIHFEDVDGNNLIDENDRQVIGDPNPDFTGMLSNRFQWKGLALEACFTFSYGNDVFNHFRYQLESMQNANNQTTSVLNRWRTDGQVTDVPKAEWGDPIGNSRFSDRWIEDGSYIRLRSVTLSYAIPIKPKAVNNLELFITGENLVTWTRYLGMDPEFSMQYSPLARGIDVGLTPQAKALYVGLKIGL